MRKAPRNRDVAHGGSMKIKPLLSPRNLALLASFAVVGIAAGGYLIVEGRQPDGYSCEGLLLSKTDASVYLKQHAPNESIDSSNTCTPQWLRTPEASESAAAEEEEQEAEGEATDRPDEAVRFRNLSLRDEHGVIPFDGLVKASQHV